MGRDAQIGLIGDRDVTIPAHRAIDEARRLIEVALDVSVSFEWVSTSDILEPSRIAAFHGIWCVPGSPYRSMEGALTAIHLARTQGRPFLGTCGGFQHALIEYARNVLNWTDAAHAETSPNAERPVVAPLACALVEIADTVHFRPGSRIAAAYGCSRSTEGYHCRYGLASAFQPMLLSGPLLAGAHDAAGEVRAIELEKHPFFVATLFQPERVALHGRVPRLVEAFVRASVAEARSTTRRR